MPDRVHRLRGSIWRGYMLVLGYLVVAFVVGGLLGGFTSPFLDWVGPLLLMAFASLGVVQLIWIVPAYLHYRRREPETAKGILIAAGIVGLLNATCWGTALF